ncbi:uncharacterized protein LOC131149528 isoform X2 [Malania oleifera]|uniref:uncharacterized protein LOC131149528 isoform X2 n=1 Tax=Malania oleifera TaxID=397392 RepID=UPI0025AECA55|nr:uncharacterized protein LOC131149528 isoform X2 [Malania oleifera]XP_057956040.1 uncharacterized protein LOC131149528 isoform X2 [Malania oleifera]
MKTYRKLHLPINLIFTIFFTISTAQQTLPNFCGKTRTQMSSSTLNSIESSVLKRMILCKSQKPYLRTSIGLFPVSSINFTSKLVTISHSSCSSSNHFVPPPFLSAGFPTQKPNSMLLFNCSNQRHWILPFARNCTGKHSCRANPEVLVGSNSCVIVDDPENLDKGFDPKALSCSHYSRVFRSSSDDDDDDSREDFELGTRISFEIPDHMPEICNECRKTNGHCGAALRCICDPKECNDKVFSTAGSINPFGRVKT